MKATLAAIAAVALLSACDRQLAGQTPTQAEANAATPINHAAVAKPAKRLSGAAALALMKQRHEDMEKIGDAMKLVGRELKKPAPDIAAIRASASTFARQATKIPSWFPPGTGPDVGKTDAKAAIWEKPEDFAAKARDFNAAAKAFDAAAKGGDLAAVKAAAGPLGKSCKACHDLYRVDD